MNLNQVTVPPLDVAASVDFYRRLGLELIVSSPQDERWLWREARLPDPSGNVICLYWAGVNRLNPPWRVGKAASIQD